MDADVTFLSIILMDTLAFTVPTIHSVCHIGYFY